MINSAKMASKMVEGLLLQALAGCRAGSLGSRGLGLVDLEGERLLSLLEDLGVGGVGTGSHLRIRIRYSSEFLFNHSLEL